MREVLVVLFFLRGLTGLFSQFYLDIPSQLRQDIAMSSSTSSKTAPEIAIEIKGLVKKYGEKFAVNGIDLTVQQGEIFALLGPNGAGKTTTVEILEGFRNIDGGFVSVLNFDPATKGEAGRVWRNRIGIVLQSTTDAADLTVQETIEHFAHYYENPRDVNEVIDSVGLREKADDYARNLSGGQRRRLDVALGIIGSPELLFLDEPTTGFDPEARRAFWELILKLRSEGTTIFLTTHYLDEAEALADRVGVITNGKIIEIATPATLGNRATAPARISWLENGKIAEIESLNPTAEIEKLIARFNGEIPQLQIIRPNLEDIYLRMIGENR
jgi:ABC-2 type transport system ATP-binding protein